MKKLILFAFIVSSLTACKFGVNSAETQKVEKVLETYEVPVPVRNHIWGMVKNMLWYPKENGGPVGKVDISPDGKLIVYASPGFQRGLKEFLQGIDVNAVQPSAVVRTEIWAVIGQPSKGESNVKTLPELNDVMEVIINKQLGLHDFKVLDKLSVLSNEGEEQEIEGNFFSFRTRSKLIGHNINTDLDLSTRNVPMRIGLPNLRTKVSGDSGTKLILAQASFLPQLKDQDSKKLEYLKSLGIKEWPKNGKIFYVVRSSIVTE